MKITEDNFVQQLKQGNEMALHYVIDRYGGLAKSIIGKHLYNLKHVEEECLDDVFLAIWDNIDTYSPEKSSFKNWLAGVTKFKAIDYKRKHLKHLNRENIEELHLESPMCVEKIILEKELSQELNSLLDNLKEVDRQLFINYYVNEEKIDSIAKKMNVKSGYLYNRLSRARKKLRQIMTNV